MFDLSCLVHTWKWGFQTQLVRRVCHHVPPSSSLAPDCCIVSLHEARFDDNFQHGEGTQGESVSVCTSYPASAVRWVVLLFSHS